MAGTLSASQAFTPCAACGQPNGPDEIRETINGLPVCSGKCRVAMLQAGLMDEPALISELIRRSMDGSQASVLFKALRVGDLTFELLIRRA